MQGFICHVKTFNKVSLLERGATVSREVYDIVWQTFDDLFMDAYMVYI